MKKRLRYPVVTQPFSYFILIPLKTNRIRYLIFTKAPDAHS